MQGGIYRAFIIGLMRKFNISIYVKHLKQYLVQNTPIRVLNIVDYHCRYKFQPGLLKKKDTSTFAPKMRTVGELLSLPDLFPGIVSYPLRVPDKWCFCRFLPVSLAAQQCHIRILHTHCVKITDIKRQTAKRIATFIANSKGKFL